MKSTVKKSEQIRLPEFYDQVLAVRKPAGWSSFDVVKKVRNLTGIRKIGHAGTLDPFATGVLLLCTGPSTKKMQDLLRYPKEYVAEIQLGSETDTMDLTGQVIRECDVPPRRPEEIRQILKRHIGELEQEIPAFSAKKSGGVRLYRLARQGKTVPVLFKKVVVYRLELLSAESNSLRLCVECGSGTYIRTLARDIARGMGTCGHVASLVRTRIGPYALKNCISIKDIEEKAALAKVC